MTAVRRLTERVNAPFAGCRVDREAGVISGMLVCGHVSDNQRDYPWGKGLAHKKGTYEGRFVNCDHGREATVDRRLGWLANEHTDAQGRPRADLHVLKAHPMADRVFEAAERNPALFGLSHGANCRTRTERGREVIEDIVDVESVDLVADPATTKGFFESRGPTVFTWKRLAEWVTRHPKSTTGQIARVKRFAEDEAMGEMPALDAEPAADAEPDDTITAALQQAGHDAWDKCVAGEMTIQELMSKLKDILKDHGKYKGEPADEPEPAAKESRKPVDSWTVLAECQQAGYAAPRPSQLKVLSLMHEAADRAEFIRDCLDAHRGGAEKPESASRHATAGLREERDAHRQVAEGRDGKTEPAGPLSLSEGPLGWSIN
jgi:hypothetical protein